MRMFHAPLLAVMAAFVAIPSMAAAETVHFRTATTPPTPLQQRLARERSQLVLEPPSEEIVGELYRPPGNGPFPAVVTLHGCSGRGPRDREGVLGARYIALAT
jgi:poly(3-hydroxybutyrate) depolymerase